MDHRDQMHVFRGTCKRWPC